MPSHTSPTLSTRSRVRETIQRRILSGEMVPGQRLTQMELARDFGVAQTVVRESLLELSFYGLVNVIENVGVFVSEFDATLLLEAYQIREIFEGLSARLCCERASRLDIERMRQLARSAWERGKENKLDEMGRFDQEFHHYTIQISRHHVLERMTEGYRLLGMVVRASRDIDEVYQEHMAIVDAIEQGDGDQAEHLARRHVQLARQSIQQQMDAGQFEPHWVVDGNPASDLDVKKKWS